MEEPREMPHVDPHPAGHGHAGVQKADIMKRFVALVIDGAIASILAWAIPVIGGFVGGAYILLRDGFDFDFMKHRSLGKQIMKLRVVRNDGQPMDLAASASRNWTLSLGLLISILAIIPILGWLGAIAVALIAPIISLIEAALVFMDPEGRRFGDRTGGTKIVESVD